MRVYGYGLYGSGLSCRGDVRTEIHRVSGMKFLADLPAITNGLAIGVHSIHSGAHGVDSHGSASPYPQTLNRKLYSKVGNL